MKRPANPTTFRCNDVELGLRLKRELEDRRKFNPRAQNNARTSDDFYVIHFEDIWREIQLDLFYGSYRFGKTLLKSKVGLTQGSPLSPAIADLVLQCIETKNASSFTLESRILGFIGYKMGGWMTSTLQWLAATYSVQQLIPDSEKTTN